MAKTLYGECRGEPIEGQIAVAWVIRNRAEHPRWWGKGVAGVCLHPYQFSCWNRSDPQYGKLKVTPELYQIALDVLRGKHPDPTGGADHYLMTNIVDRTKWARENPKKKTVEIGVHSFYRLEI